jgi:hypothetical protein
LAQTIRGRGREEVLGHQEKLFLDYCNSSPESEAPPVFKGQYCAPPLSADELKEVGFECIHQVHPGDGYIFPRRCWHFVRNGKPDLRDTSGQYASEDDANSKNQQSGASARGDSIAWDLRLVAYDRSSDDEAKSAD